MKLGGWLRLWIAVSIAWLWVASYRASTELATLETELRYVVGPTTVVFSSAEPGPDIERFVHEQLIPGIVATPETFSNVEIRRPYEAYVRAHRPRIILNAVAVALIPPFLWLIIGYFLIRLARIIRAPATAVLTPGR